MPYEWTRNSECVKLELWPYRSLPKTGFVIVISIAVLLLALPALAIIGTMVLWGLLPFMAIAVGALWWGLQKSYRDGEILEELEIQEYTVRLTRLESSKPSQAWECNPYWIKVTMHESKGPVPHYVTLKGNGREVEIGAFLSEDERRKLYSELLAEFKKLS